MNRKTKDKGDSGSLGKGINMWKKVVSWLMVIAAIAGFMGYVYWKESPITGYDAQTIVEKQLKRDGYKHVEAKLFAVVML